MGLLSINYFYILVMWKIVYKKKCHPHGQHFHDFPSYKTLYVGHISILVSCLILTALRNTLRIYDFVPRFGFPLFPILLQLGSKSFT